MKYLHSKCQDTRSRYILKVLFAHNEAPIWPIYIVRDIEQLEHERAALQDRALHSDELDLIMKSIDCKKNHNVNLTSYGVI